jgi:hypothetical protein
VKALGCGYLQSYYLLKGGQLIKSGYEMDTLSNARILNYYRLLPFMSNCYKVQIYRDNKVYEKN